MNFWLMKSEPDEFSIDDLAKAPKQTTPWFGVRNYQARNFMRDDMRVGDRAFFYHSSCPEPGIAGIVEISKRAAPRWFNFDVKLVRKTRFVTVSMLRETPGLAEMVTLRRGNRLSITPVTAAEWKIVDKLASGF